MNKLDVRGMLKQEAARHDSAGQDPDPFYSERRAELSRARILCRALAQGTELARRDDVAALFVRQALGAFALRRAPSLKLSHPYCAGCGTLDHVALQLAETIGRDAAELPLIEGLHYITSLYPAMLSQITRSKFGAFYTPPCLVSRLLDQASEQDVDWTTVNVLDPACGAGAFLIEAALRMSAAIKDSEPVFALRHIASRIAGLEADANAANFAQWALEITLADLAVAADAPIPIMIRVCDTLDERPQEEFGLVVGNPPYGRVALTLEQRARFSRSLFGHANLYGVFTDIALRWTKPNGVIAYLTPASFLAGQYYAALRELLAKEAPPVAIDFVHARRGVFEDALQETCLATYVKGRDRSRARIHYIQVANERDCRLIRNGTVGVPLDARSPWLAPRAPDHAALIASAEKMRSRLFDWGYRVSTGPLVWNRFKPQRRDGGGGFGVHPLIWAECVTAEGRFVYRALKKSHSPFFKLERGDEWLLVQQSCVLVQRTTAKEQARRLIAAELPEDFVVRHGGVVVENHLNMVRAVSSATVPASVVAAVLNSSVVDELFRCMSGSVAVSAFELEALPLPSVSDLIRLTRLVAEGATRKQIDDECDRLYGRDPE